MKLIMRICLGIAGLLVAALVLFFLVHFVGYGIAAEPMEELRSSIEVGMNRAEVRTIVERYEDVHDYGSASEMQLSQSSSNFTSPIVGSWFCFVKVQMENDVVESMDDVFCVD